MKTIDTALPVTDPVIQEVRRRKREIAEAFGFDVVASRPKESLNDWIVSRLGDLSRPT